MYIREGDAGHDGEHSFDTWSQESFNWYNFDSHFLETFYTKISILWYVYQKSLNLEI